jgi:glycolate oxidase FAD binding subunit
MQTGSVSLEDLRSIVEHVHEATLEDAVDGVQPAFVAEPGSVEESSELLQMASERGLAVAPRGGGTKMEWGNLPRGLDLVLSTARMSGVIEHVAGDQVVRVRAGTRLAELQESLSGADQMLGLDPPEEGATIGGIVSSNATGPRRHRYGTVRDLIIGITVVLADGTVAKSGGKVVKNVAGYDLGKLFTGSLGTLGLVAECNFRLHPRPETARTVAVVLSSTGAAGEAAQAIVHAPLVPSAVELRWEGKEGLLTALIEGIPPAVEAQTETAKRLLGQHGEVRDLPEAVPPATLAGEVEVKISAPPAELAGVLDSILDACSRREVEPRIAAHAGVGVTNACLSGGGEEAQVAVVEELREMWSRRGGSVVVRRAPLAVKERLDVWGAAGDAIGLMKSVKCRFDPRNIMNPGRFVGGI